MSCIAVGTNDLLTCGQGVTPGISENFYYALARQLTAVPKKAALTTTTTLVQAATAEATGEFTFATGGKFGKLEGAVEISFEDPLEGGKRQKTTKPKLTAKFNRSAEAEGFRNLYKNEQLIIVFKDGDGVMRMIGNLDFPAYMVEGPGTINDTEKSISMAFEAAIHAALILPDNVVLPFTPAT